MHKIIAGLLVLMMGCTVYAPGREQAQRPLPVFVAVFNEYKNIESDGIKEKILEIKEDLKISNNPSLHLRLSILLCHYKNDKPDYQRALKELELYLSSADAEKEEILLSFYSLLKEIANLSSNIARLEKNNRELKEKLELLKSLDVEIEKKRIRSK